MCYMNMTDYTRLGSDIYTVEVIENDILVVTIDRVKYLNAIPRAYHDKLADVWTLFENDPRLRVGIITSKGKFFCGGADMKEWSTFAAAGEKPDMIGQAGFLGLSNRETKKPIIAALNGPTFGGGSEALLNCELAVAVSTATIQFPEARVGVVALAGALPRLGRLLGLKRATEMALVAEPITAQTALEWGLVNRVVEDPRQLIPTALDLAKRIRSGNPDSIFASLKGIRRGYSDTKLTLIEATDVGSRQEINRLQELPNMKEGIFAFLEKRKAQWVPSKL
jgi:enoyl-CoA hydratase/carnithine racemase